MAINKNAKNLFITIENKYTSTTKTFIENAAKVEIAAVVENLILVSNKKISIMGKK